MDERFLEAMNGMAAGEGPFGMGGGGGGPGGDGGGGGDPDEWSGAAAGGGGGGGGGGGEGMTVEQMRVKLRELKASELKTMLAGTRLLQSPMPPESPPSLFIFSFFSSHYLDVLLPLPLPLLCVSFYTGGVVAVMACVWPAINAQRPAWTPLTAWKRKTS
eukprot:COSAG05_NODE_2947_length_2475_cov_1.507155_2_plen_160_part_00